jgi:hypothetical protein
MERGALRRQTKGWERYARALGARPSICIVALLLWVACASAPKTFAVEKVGFINVDGAIGPATASYISRSIEEAKAQNVQCLVIQLNTPGGLLDSTQKIVQSFLGSPVPVVVYVAPTPKGKEPEKGQEIRISNFLDCKDSWYGPQTYIIPLTRTDTGYRVTPLRMKQETNGPFVFVPRIYPDTPETRAQLNQLPRR